MASDVSEIEVTDFGGLNTGLHPAKIGDNEFALLENWAPYGEPGRRELRRRGGTKRITAKLVMGTGLPSPEQATSFFRYKSSFGLWALLVGQQMSISVLDAGAQRLRRLSADGEYSDSLIPWVWAQYKDVAYAFRDGPGMVRVQLYPYENVHSAGIAAPTQAPSLVDGGAGTIPAADFKGVVTCYNSLTDTESNPGSASSTLSLGANRKIAWNNIPVCPEPQVNARRLWRTLPNQTGAYFLVATINDNVTTNYPEDDNTVDELGKAVSFKNGLPPGNLLMGTIWNDRAWVSDGSTLYFSGIGHPEGFDPADAISVFPDDGAHITGLLADQDRLYIQKNNAIHYLTGTSRGSYDLHTLDSGNGGWSAHSIKSVDGRLFWLDFDGLYTSTGGPGQAVGDIAMRRYFDAIDRDLMYLSHMTQVVDKNLLLITVPMLDEATEIANGRAATLVYNYKTNTWSTWVVFRDSVSLNFMDAILDRFDEPVLWAAFGYHLFTHDDPAWNMDEADVSQHGGRDAPLAIIATIKTKDFTQGGNYLAVRRLKILHDPVAPTTSTRTNLGGVFAATLYKDGQETPIKSRSLFLQGGTDWHHYGLSTIGDPGASVQLALQYRGKPEFRVQAIGLEVSQVKRRRRAS